MNNKAKILITICLYDLLLTTIGLQTGVVEEANPILRYYLGYGLIYFILIKVFINGACIAPVEIYSRVRELTKKEVLLFDRFYNMAITAYILSLIIFTK